MPLPSRYRKVSIVILLDKQGNLSRSRGFRLPVRVAGTFEHVLGEQERLDHLATKYYRQPRTWWHICDANPEFLSPLALVGAEPVVTDEFPLVFTDKKLMPQTNELLRQLTALSGVERVKLTNTVEIMPEVRQLTLTEQVTVQVEYFQWVIAVTYNTTVLTAAQVGAQIQSAGFRILPPTTLRRTGKRIIIPPGTAG